VTVGEGVGALLALPLVQAAASLAAELPEKEPETSAKEGEASGEKSEDSGEEPAL
jgi:nicotinate-nucleotide--dimethylbenzimidazole phosphoribosyltransferase